MARRYYITTLPIAHINGKMAPVSVTCPNSTGERENEGFYYGYRHRTAPHISRYAIRKKSRNLLRNPVTHGEIENQSLFSNSQIIADTHMLNTAEREKVKADFRRQRAYTTLRGFAFAGVYKNGGEWPEKWAL